VHRWTAQTQTAAGGHVGRVSETKPRGRGERGGGGRHKKRAKTKRGRCGLEAVAEAAQATEARNEWLCILQLLCEDAHRAGAFVGVRTARGAAAILVLITNVGKVAEAAASGCGSSRKAQAAAVDSA